MQPASAAKRYAAGSEAGPLAASAALLLAAWRSPDAAVARDTGVLARSTLDPKVDAAFAAR